MSLTPQASAPSNQPCPFLDLPPEIRNHIYQFALTSAFGYLRLQSPSEPGTTIHSSVSPSIDDAFHRTLLINSDDADLDTEFNQLKFVSKQLYQETAGIEVRFNDIVIAKKWSSELSLGTQLLQFIQLVSISKRHWLVGCTFRLKDLRCSAIRFPMARWLPGFDPISHIVRTRHDAPYVPASYIPFSQAGNVGEDDAVGELVFDGVVFAHVARSGGLRLVLPAIKAHAPFVYR